jgi:hypothetical protein
MNRYVGSRTIFTDSDIYRTGNQRRSGFGATDVTPPEKEPLFDNRSVSEAEKSGRLKNQRGKRPRESARLSG